mmetsp:Transcript_28955/g.65620  ORF Transcript_28955/g.65620 Transcript_28955/m.65620 type:complete len:307 (-) Transcript_28955:725-1645(-)
MDCDHGTSFGEEGEEREEGVRRGAVPAIPRGGAPVLQQLLCLCSLPGHRILHHPIADGPATDEDGEGEGDLVHVVRVPLEGAARDEEEERIKRAQAREAAEYRPAVAEEERRGGGGSDMGERGAEEGSFPVEKESAGGEEVGRPEDKAGGFKDAPHALLREEEEEFLERPSKRRQQQLDAAGEHPQHPEEPGKELGQRVFSWHVRERDHGELVEGDQTRFLFLLNHVVHGQGKRSIVPEIPASVHRDAPVAQLTVPRPHPHETALDARDVGDAEVHVGERRRGRAGEAAALQPVRGESAAASLMQG